MSFQPVESQVDFPAQERATLDFWRRTDAFENTFMLSGATPLNVEKTVSVGLNLKFLPCLELLTCYRRLHQRF